MNYKGKIVTVAFYKYFTSKPYKIVTGKVTYIHTSQGIMDTAYITIIDDKGKKHTGIDCFRILDKSL